MRNSFWPIAILLALLLCGAPVLSANDSSQGVPLQGEYVGPTEPQARDLEEKDDEPITEYRDLPVIDPDLLAQAAELEPFEMIRVIIFLAYQPQDVISKQIREKYAPEMNKIRGEVKAINSRYAAERSLDVSSDSESYESMAMSEEDLEAMREINEKHEALSLKVKKETTAALSAEIDSYQQSLKDSIEFLGGEVEFTTIAGNAIVALIPAGSLRELAADDKIDRLVGDKVLERGLNVADDATRVNATGGLWANGETGGIYDPAVLDTGTDLDHPALEDGATRDNFFSWYLVAAAAAANWNDSITEDDLQGHGTHVMGIVASYGTSVYPNHLGMAHGVEKAVTLKAGYRNTANGGSMFWSDAMYLVDRALYETEDLQPWNTFNDDVEGINLSYWGQITTDETDFGRFWDSVVSTYSDFVFITIAGNAGPSNTRFSDPGVSHNAITVASVDDMNTTTRDDDTIAPYSSRGPTAGNRKKPDIAAPGSDIHSCNSNWETAADFRDDSGTSMAAPMVLGVAMDLMDAGVFDEKEIKALLINNAQKNEPGINFESDADGWSTAYGWGYMNAWAAYYHRADVDSYTVTERNTPDDYILLSGQMRDEGSGGEGRDRATMVWNRHATYNPHDYPTTYYTLSDLDLQLYNETTGAWIDSDADVNDNVHQVRIGSGASTTDVVVKAYAYSTDFPHGGTTESFALATEENFVEVDLPGSFGGVGSWPTEMEPNEERDFTFWLNNNSDIASHSNQFDLILPSGWSRVSGPDPYSAGSIAAGGTSSSVTWRLKAQSSPQDGVSVTSQHTHNSYAEAWGPFNWGMGVNVRLDTTPPTPNPMTWSTVPYELNTSQIRMTATTASDLHGPVEYYFLASALTGGGGASSSGWQTSTTYTDSGLGANHQYRYWARARDKATTPNYTAYSASSDEYTDIETPTGVTFGSYGSTYIYARSTNTPSGLTRGSSGLIIYNSTAGTNSGWKQDNNYWYSSGLTPNTSYAFRAKARNGDGSETAYSNFYYRRTAAATPGAAGFTNVTCTSIQANWTANSNPAGTEYFCENVTTGGNSGWTTATSWNNTGLDDQSLYEFRVKARNAEGVQTGWRQLGSQLTSDCTAPTPNPMTWSTVPYELNSSQIRMLATIASDPTTPINYSFDFYSSPTGGGGGTDSVWQTSRTYTDFGLSTNHQYGYRVRARDGANNMTAYSAVSYDYTAIETPTGITFGAIATTSIQARSTNTPSGLARGSSGLYVQNQTAGTASGWNQNNNYWTSSGLSPNTQYGFRAIARNGDGNQTPWSATSSRYTLANQPGAAGFSNVTQTSIRANWTANGNPAGTEYYCENVTAGTGSGWITGTSWASGGLTPGTAYTFRVRAKNGNDLVTAWVSLGTQSTLSYDPPVIDNIAFNGCLSEHGNCSFTPVTVTAHDPEGGGLTYAYTPLNGGTISGSGSSVTYDAPNSGPHPCPYNVRVEVTSSASGLTTEQTIGITVKLAGDADGNGGVNVVDKVLVRNAFGTSPPIDPRADVNCDGTVNVVDKVLVRNQFGQSGCGCP